MDHRSRPVGILVFVSLVLAAAGNVLGNPVADRLLAGRKSAAPALLALVTLAAIGVGVRLAALQAEATDPRRHSRRRQRVIVGLLVAGMLLAAAGGVLSNVAANYLPLGLQRFALPLFMGVLLLAIGVAILLYLLQNAPRVEGTNRRNFLSRLQSRYGQRRENALQGAALITLGLQEVPDAVARPALALDTLPEAQQRIEREQPEQGLATAHALPAGTTIGQVYDTAGGHLLILGEPGAGKTTLLVELGLDLVQRARSDAQFSLAVLLNLSSWANDRLRLEEWLVEDLVNSYQVPRKVAQAWVARDALLPLLDGLDEVAEAERPGCVAAINAFHLAHPRLPLVVCSRTTEYRAQAAPLALETAVTVQPLTDVQIHDFLALGGEKLAALQAAVEEDADLREVVRTPLMLSLVTLTYEDLPREAIPPLGDRSGWREQLFQDYVTRMLERERRLEAMAAYAPEETQRRLAWLARQMQAHGLVEFYVEHLQPDWLPTRRPRQLYRVLVVLALLGVGGLMGLLGGLGVSALLGRLSLGVDENSRIVYQEYQALAMEFGIGVGLGVGLFAGLVAGARSRVQPAEVVRWSWRRARAGLKFGLLGGLVVGGYALVTHVTYPLSHIVLLPSDAAVTVLLGAVVGLLLGLTFGMLAGQSRAVGAQRSWKRVRAGAAIGAIGGAIAGSLASVAWSNLYFYLSGTPFVGVFIDLLNSSSLDLLIAEVGIALFGWLVFGSGLLGGSLAETQPFEPSARARWSRRGALVGLALGGLVGPLVLVVSDFLYAPVSALIGPLFTLVRDLLNFPEEAALTGLIQLLIQQLILAVLLALLLSVVGGIGTGTVDVQDLVTPNQGIRRSLRHGLVGGCIGAAVGALLGALIFGVPNGLSLTLFGGHTFSNDLAGALSATGFSALVGGLLIGLIAWISLGGMAVMQHVVLRWRLQRCHAMPLNYVRFLDYAADHVLLQKVGGGYRFIHVLLRDYFASEGEGDQALAAGRTPAFSHANVSTL